VPPNRNRGMNALYRTHRQQDAHRAVLETAWVVAGQGRGRPNAGNTSELYSFHCAIVEVKRRWHVRIARNDPGRVRGYDEPTGLTFAGASILVRGMLGRGVARCEVANDCDPRRQRRRSNITTVRDPASRMDRTTLVGFRKRPQ